MKKTLRPLAALVAVALIGGGCGSDEAPSSARTDPATDQDRAAKFADCMRTNGVPDFPDANAEGEFVFGINVSPAVWTKAVRACKELQPPGSLSAKRTPKEQTASLRFAGCMRENGVKDFPDPANGEPLVDTTRIPSTDRDGGMTILNAAMAKCRSVMDEAASGR